ncbi:hypothetical protein [Sinomicrobium sp.]
MRTLLAILIIGLFYSCNSEKKKLLAENNKLKLEIDHLKTQIDSLNALPSVKFEKLAVQDKILDSLRTIKGSSYISDLKWNKLKTDDSLMTDSYMKFAKENPGSILSVVAYDRIGNIYNSRNGLDYNQITGTYKLDSIKGLCFTPDYKVKVNERLEITSDKKFKVYKNGVLVENRDFELVPIPIWYYHTKLYIEGKGFYAISVKTNKSIAIGKAAVIGGEFKVYEKVD